MTPGELLATAKRLAVSYSMEAIMINYEPRIAEFFADLIPVLESNAGCFFCGNLLAPAGYVCPSCKDAQKEEAETVDELPDEIDVPF